MKSKKFKSKFKLYLKEILNRGLIIYIYYNIIKDVFYYGFKISYNLLSFLGI